MTSIIVGPHSANVVRRVSVGEKMGKRVSSAQIMLVVVVLCGTTLSRLGRRHGFIMFVLILLAVSDNS